MMDRGFVGDMSFLRGGRQLYLAYGSNANLTNMLARCPRAIPIGTVCLPGYELVFRGIANVIKKRNARIFCVLWSITPRCEALLDWYEEFPRLYVKSYIRSRKYRRPMMMYALKYPLLNKYPAENYIKCIGAGYASFNIPEEQLTSALGRSTKGKVNQYSTPRFNYKV